LLLTPSLQFNAGLAGAQELGRRVSDYGGTL